MTDTTLDTLPLVGNRSDRVMTADEVEYRRRFDVPGLWPASATEEQRENYMLWAYIHYLRARWEHRSRVLRPSLWLRLRVAWRAAWIGVDDPGDL